MASKTTEDAPNAYVELLDHYETIVNVGAASGVLGWDQQVTMPEGGTPARSQQLSTLSGIRHDLLTEDKVGDWLDELEDSNLTPDQRAAVREIRREYEREIAVPKDLVEELSAAMMP
ncbi:MAG: carboxypeptidase M32, partial [Halobacteriaceae archaeon]